MSEPTSDAPAAVIFGCAGPQLAADEDRFFRDIDPLGFILFARNCETPDQIRSLTQALRASVGRDDAPILIDQEGGRVQRLKPPTWRAAPAAGRFGGLAHADPAAAVEAARLNARLIAAELQDVGVNVDCLPCLDVPAPDGHDIIGDRAFGNDPNLVATLGRAVADGLIAGGVLPVAKHMPGHGRARADSHLELPIVDTPATELETTDFAPFSALADLPLGMTAHVVYSDIDADAPATVSRKVIDDIIRKRIGFDGLLMSDDLGMQALAGDFATRTSAALAAGCDVVLHCSGVMSEMKEVAAAARSLDADGRGRADRALTTLGPADDIDLGEALARVNELLAAVAV